MKKCCQIIKNAECSSAKAFISKKKIRKISGLINGENYTQTDCWLLSYKLINSFADSVFAERFGYKCIGAIADSSLSFRSVIKSSHHHYFREGVILF